MDTLDNLQRRITVAFQRIEKAALSAEPTDSIPSDPMRRLAETNVALAAQLDFEKTRRVASADALDLLIKRLKPILESSTNA